VVVFEVDDVAPAATGLPTQPLGEVLGETLALGGDPTLAIVPPDGMHPLLSAVRHAFVDHRPLVLSPDAVWLTITQGITQHIRLHAEQLRPRLVAHAERRRLTVVVDGTMPRDGESWGQAVETFHKLLGAEIRAPEVFECDFSTSTDVERIAGRIVLFDAYSPYFTLWMTCICGIPSITLTGTVADWQKIRSRVGLLAELGLETWQRSLVPVTDQFVRAASGDVDTAFWQRLYNPRDAYGGDVITGWAARFYPYLRGTGAVDQPNPLLDLPIDEPHDVPVDATGYHGPGIRSDQVPAVLSRVVVNVSDRADGDSRAVALHAGLVGVAQDDDGALRPVASWYLTPASVEMGTVIDRLVREHDVTPPQPERAWQLQNTSAEVIALYDRIGSATLFGGAWRLLPVAEHRRVQIPGSHRSILVVVELADGRSVGEVLDVRARTSHWVVCHLENADAGQPSGRVPRLRLADVPVFGSSLALLLDAALDSGGDIAHLETGRLLDLV
jgi:hypothetical protein